MKIQRPALLALLTLSFALGGLSAPASAQFSACLLGEEFAFGECFEDFVPHRGEIPYGATGQPGTTTLYVVDLFSGFFYEYDAASLSTAPIVRPSPLGAAQYTGIAATATNLYWIVQQFGATGQVLVQSDLSGTLLSTTAITSPTGGTIADLTYAPDTDTLWALDADSDVIFELTPSTAAPTGNQFPIPGAAGTGSLFGTSLAFAIDQTTLQGVVDVPFGAASAGGVNSVTRFSTTGVPFGRSYDPTNLLPLETISGIAWVDTTIDLGQPSHVLLDASDNRLIVVPLGEAEVREVTELTCVSNPDNTVSIDWTNPDVYAEIRIRRTGPSNATILLPGTDATFLDSTSAEGLNRYRVDVRAAGSTEFVAEVECLVVVGQGRQIASAPLTTPSPYAIAAVDVPGGTQTLYIADAFTGDIERLELDLTASSLGTLTNPVAGTPVSGLAWNDETDRLLWLFQTSTSPLTYQITETDFDGTNADPLTTLTVPSGGVLGDVSFEAAGVYWGVDTSNGEYFSFGTDGAAIDSGLALPAGSSAGEGIAATTNQLLVPTLSTQSDSVDQITVLDTAFLPNNSFPIGPSIPTQFAAGVAAVEVGTTGSRSLFVVGFETQTITEISALEVGAPFLRGDVNDSGTRDIVDALDLIGFLFSGSTTECEDALDTDDSGEIELADVIDLLSFLVGGAALPDPIGSCAVDPTVDTLGCGTFQNCPE